MSQQPCPDPTVLAAFGRGELPEEVFEKLAAHVPDCPSCQHVLARLGDSGEALLAGLRQVEKREDNGPQPDTRPTQHDNPVAVSPIQAPPGYELLDEIGRGGMGMVYRARDSRLNREVAIKLLRDDYPAHSAVCTRFIAEAQITGQLQHPGIPAVHELGQLPDGRPFLAMKLVKGRTLHELLQERGDPGQDRGRFLAIFEQICQAVGYAHAHRVIHRDLKPGNVMVGAFGEVQVMDWGLAKLLNVQASTAEDEAALPETLLAVTAIETPQQAGSATRTGSVMGTPAYMAPEQAGGEVRKLDARSDVFGLGAILCEILTGIPPYQGKDALAVRLQAVRGELGDTLSRLDACGAEPEMVTLCKRCLVFRQEDRPADGGAVAAEVAGIRQAAEERARRAELEQAEAQVKAREERKRRRWAWAAVFLLLAGVAGSTWQAVRAMRAEGLARENETQAVEAAKAELAAKRLAEQAADSERKAKDLAQTRLGHIEKVNEVLTSIFHDLDPRSYGGGGRGLLLQLSQHLERAVEQLDKAEAGDPVGVARLLTAMGGSLRHLDQAQLAIKILPKALKTLEDNLGPDHPDTLMARHNLFSAYLYVNRQDEAIPQLEKNFALRKLKLGPHHPDTLLSGNNLASAYSFAGRIKDSIRVNEQILKEQESHLGVDHPHTFKTRNNLAAGYLNTGRSADAIRLLEPFLKKLEAKLGDDYQLVVLYRNHLALAYQKSDRTGDAIRLSEQNLKWSETKLGLDNPDTLSTRNILAEAYQSIGRRADVIRLYEQNLKLSEAKLGADDSATLYYRNELAIAYFRSGRTLDAIRLDEQNLKLREAKLGMNHPHTLLSMANLGVDYREVGRLKDAIALLEKALERGRKRSGELPETISWVPASLAETYDRAGQYAKSESFYREYLEQAQRQFGSADPRTAGAFATLAANLLKQKKCREAEPLLRQCLTIRTKVQPDAWNTFDAQSLLGGALLGQKKYAEAEPLLVKGYEGMKQREAKIPKEGKVRLIEAVTRLVQLYDAWGKPAEAAEWRKKVSQRNPTKNKETK